MRFGQVISVKRRGIANPFRSLFKKKKSSRRKKSAWGTFASFFSF